MDYSHYEFIKVEKDGKVAVFTLNRPESLNAITPQLHTEIEDIFADVANDSDVNAVVLTGAGRAFCAGGDVKGMDTRQSDAPSQTRGSLSNAKRLIMLIETSKRGISQKAPRKDMGIPIVVQKASLKFRKSVRHRKTSTRPMLAFLLRRSILALRTSVSSSHKARETP